MFRPWMLVVIGLVLSVVAAPAFSQTGSGATDGRPDLLFVILPQGETAEVSVTFPNLVSHALVRERLARLARAGGWAMSTPDIRDEHLVTSAKYGRPTSLGAQTGATVRFRGAPLARNSGFLLQPFLETFRDVGRYEILYFVRQQPDFMGLRQFSSPEVAIRLITAGGPYRYVVENRDRTHALPVVPVTQPVVSASTVSNPTRLGDGATAGSSGAQEGIAGYGLVVLLAAGAGLFVYVVLRMLARR